MLKKFGIVSVGVTAGLLAAAPLASASDFGDVDGKFNNQCESTAGDIENDATGIGGAAGIGQVAGPVLSGSNANVLNCSNILNENLNDNNVSLGILGDAASLSGN